LSHGRLEGNRQIERPTVRRKGNINIDVKEAGMRMLIGWKLIRIWFSDGLL
jgi:hypothetical protein